MKSMLFVMCGVASTFYIWGLLMAWALVERGVI